MPERPARWRVLFYIIKLTSQSSPALRTLTLTLWSSEVELPALLSEAAGIGFQQLKSLEVRFPETDAAAQAAMISSLSALPSLESLTLIPVRDWQHPNVLDEDVTKQCVSSFPKLHRLHMHGCHTRMAGALKGLPSLDDITPFSGSFMSLQKRTDPMQVMMTVAARLPETLQNLNLEFSPL